MSRLTLAAALDAGYDPDPDGTRRCRWCSRGWHDECRGCDCRHDNDEQENDVSTYTATVTVENGHEVTDDSTVTIHDDNGTVVACCPLLARVQVGGHIAPRRIAETLGALGYRLAGHLADQPGAVVYAVEPIITHACPEAGSGVTPCCGKTPFELSKSDRLTIDVALVTCRPGSEC